MLSCLKSAAADFIIVGAYALAAHGFVRATGDIDIWVRNTPENAQRVLRALAEFGAPTAGLSEDDFTTTDAVLQIGVEPSRVDILTGVDGLRFEEAWAGSVTVVVDGIETRILSKADLLKNKLSSGRDKDQGDIVWLKKNQDRES